LDKNLECRTVVHDDVWKHAPPASLDPGKKHVYITKHPLSWLVSYKNYRAQESGVEPDAFTSLQLYASWHQAWNNKNALHVRYEDALHNPKKEGVGAVKHAYDFDESPLYFRNLEGRVMPADNDAQVRLGGSFDASYYLDEEWLDEYENETASALWSWMKERNLTRVAGSLGYADR
jgi:hypothetical protein